MRVLILGAGGFLGRHVAGLLNNHPAFVVVTAPPSRDLDLSRATPEQWNTLLQDADPDAVINCAGRTHGTEAELTLANVTLVQQLIGAAQERRPPPRIVHLGSAAEYGPHARCVSEDTPARPVGAYGESKLAGTRALLGARPSVPVTVLRVCNPIGTGQGAQTLTGLAALKFEQALQGHCPEVEFGDLSPARDFIDARDVARAVQTVLRHPPAEPVINVGRGEAVPARTLIRALAVIAQYRGTVREGGAGSSRSASLPWQQADVSRLSTLGWAPAYSLQNALQSLWQGVHIPSSLPSDA